MNFTSKHLLAAGACALIAGWTSSASAKQWVDYSPGKGVWEVTTVKVDPNKIDDYLVGLKKSWVPEAELSKKHGVIDDYFVMVKLNASDGQGNVLLGQHFTNFAVLDPNKERDQTMDKEGQVIMSDAQAKKMVEGYDKYRTFVGDDYWTSVEFGK